MFTILNILNTDDEMADTYARVVLNNIFSVATISDPEYQKSVFETLKGYVDFKKSQVDDEEDKRIIEDEKRD